MVATPKYTYPIDRAAKRQVLLDAVESIRDVIAAHADEAEMAAAGRQVERYGVRPL